MDSTLVIAMIGAITGVVGVVTGVWSLGWQIHVHRQSRPRVALEVSNSLPMFGPNSDTPGDWQIGVEVRNVGGAPLTVTNWGIHVPGGNLVLQKVLRWSQQPPVAVESGGAPVKFFYPADELRRLHAERGIPFAKMRVWVETGDGRRVTADGGIPLA